MTTVSPPGPVPAHLSVPGTTERLSGYDRSQRWREQILNLREAPVTSHLDDRNGDRRRARPCRYLRLQLPADLVAYQQRAVWLRRDELLDMISEMRSAITLRLAG